MIYRKISLVVLFMAVQQIVGANTMTDSVIVFNAGINGNNTADLLGRIERDVLKRSPQIVVLMIGTNDMLNTRNMLSLKQYERNYQQIISKLKAKSELIMMTIPPVNSNYIIIRKPELNYRENQPQERVDSANSVIRRLAKKNKCTLLDLAKIMEGCGGSGTEASSLFQNEANSGTMDGVHPTAEGYRVIATAVYQAICCVQPGVKRIVCFGDSITYGYKVKGEGTTEGQCYPAILKTILNL